MPQLKQQLTVAGSHPDTTCFPAYIFFRQQVVRSEQQLSEQWIKRFVTLNTVHRNASTSLVVASSVSPQHGVTGLNQSQPKELKLDQKAHLLTVSEMRDLYHTSWKKAQKTS